MVSTFRSSAAIEINALSKTYGKRKNPVKAVDNLNLGVQAGQVFGFLGANGAGKTTTIKMICGLVTPTAGSVRVNGHDVTRERSAAMRQIGAVLEGTRNVYWRLSAWENLMYFGHLKGIWGKTLKIRAETLLKELELWDRRDDSIRMFSRGMQQKVAIACSLVADPPVVLLDEPTLGLDIQAAHTVKDWILKLTKEQGKTVVLTTHQLDMAQELCDRVAIIHKGRLLRDQPLSELLHLFSHEYYEIRVKGHLDGSYSSSFEELAVGNENGDTVFSGTIADQAALHRHLSAIHHLNLPLLSVTRVEPDLEDVFVQLLEGKKGESHEDRVVSYVQ